MKKLKVPDYDVNTVNDLQNYAITTTAKDPWNHGKTLTKTFKKEVTRLLTIEQDKRCVYCESRLHESRPARDHIAPWSVHREWMYLPENLVLACFACNTDRKKAYNPIVTKDIDYSKCEFSIIHPYFDDPDEHITFEVDGLNILVQVIHGSSKGKNTIDLFQLATPERTLERAGDVITSVRKEELSPEFLKMAEEFLAQALKSRLKTKAKI